MAAWRTVGSHIAFRSLLIATASFVVSCSTATRQPSRPATASRDITTAGARPATAQPVGGARGIASAQPSAADHPLLDAESPDLPPVEGALQASPVADRVGIKGPPHGASLNLPAGFSASVYAATGGGPRFMALGSDGAVYVALMLEGSVVRLDDHGGSATPTTVLDGLNQPSSVAFFGGYLYVGETDAIARYAFTATGVDRTSREVVVPHLPTGGHLTRTVAFGPDGLMYVAVGSSCNVCIESDPLRATISVYNPDGSGGRRYAGGLRNAVGLAWNPATGELWATVNGRDDIGQDMGLSGQAAQQATDNLPPDYVTRVDDGGDYGWPRCYGDHQLDPIFGDAAFCATTIAPTVELQAHSAPLGLAFYTGAQFPSDFEGSLIVATHGSWDRQTPTGYKLIRVSFSNGQPVSVEDFVTGWVGADGFWGRPVGLLVLPDGSLLVSDDSAGGIYRISFGD
jgi:glucose/arabinose dehydrogenase